MWHLADLDDGARGRQTRARARLRRALLSAACWLVAAVPGAAQTGGGTGGGGPHVHHWTVYTPPSGSFRITRNGFTEDVEYARRWTTVSLSMTSESDIDQCTNPGCSFPNGMRGDPAVHPISWSDNGFGGDFGYYDNSGFVRCDPTDVDHITDYRTPADHSGVVTITVTIDDPGTTLADDAPVQVSKQFTCWEFTISHCPGGWIPSANVGTDGTLSGPDDSVEFKTEITPGTDHHGSSMADYITWRMIGVSHEPGFCMNSGPVYIGDPSFNLERKEDSCLQYRDDHTYDDIHYQNAYSKDKLLVDALDLWNYDFGTHDGQLEAQIALGPARLEGTLHDLVSPFPIDANQNGIADADPRDGGGASAMDDADGGMGTPGDGLTR
jgi:hypothetical protein